MLFIVSTPIGNLKDITLRAIDTLREVDLILAEDTRRTGILLREYMIKDKQILSYNDANKTRRTKQAIELLKQGKNISLVSDSGTPGISDPGFYLVREAVKYNIQISPIPGPTAHIAALVCSGLPTDKFGFFGFLPKKDGRKRDVFEWISKTENLTFIYYESPHRIIKTLRLMDEIIPDKQIVIARELTKKFEEFIRGTVKGVYQKLKDKKIKGEIVLIIS
ncbi:16S rRNA (cytidine(1402)-2'-O)-methyltransferase [Candidatus Woesearchaeota archaeon]|nr:16S rRNA (cytidine(1402)-2'-O)-methyltransferase [Candidatus Woesearchaeota archaeon]